MASVSSRLSQAVIMMVLSASKLLSHDRLMTPTESMSQLVYQTQAPSTC